MARIAASACVALAFALTSGLAGAQPAASRSWAAPQIEAVVASGLMGPSVERFRPEDPLTWTELTTVLASFGSPVPFVEPSAPVTLRELDAHLVTLAGLRLEARAIRVAAKQAGLMPKASLGTETVARMLGLRVNHLRGEEELELQLSEPATRAEAAYSIARVLSLQPSELEAVRDAAGERRGIVAAALALSIVAKLFLWPMLVWLAATRRVGAAALAAGAAVLALLAGWAAIGFAGFMRYPELVDRLTDVVGDRGYSLMALGSALGLDDGVARVLPFAVGLPLLALAVVAARGFDGDRRAFALCVAASIVLTPIVWLHYFTLLLAPLAIARPRLSPAWLLALAFWVTPFQENEGAGWRVVVALALLAATTVVALTSRRPVLRPAA
jgi:hypothetical protein